MGMIRVRISDAFWAIDEQKLFRESQDMEVQIQRLVETITMNIGYPISMQNLQVLFDHTFYFDICCIIFPELSTKITKIHEDSCLDPAHKMQQLLELLTEELQQNLAALSGREILKGHLLHLYRFLITLEEYSELPLLRPALPKQGNRRRVHSMPFLNQIQKNTKIPQSARDNHKQRDLSDITNKTNNQLQTNQIPNLQEPNTMILNTKSNEKQKGANNLKKNNASSKKIKELGHKDKKLRGSKKILKAIQSRITEGNRNKQYKTYLQKFMKADKKKREENLQGLKKRAKSAKPALWKKQIKEIDDYFKSFELKLRDQKQKYLIKMQHMVRDQENERMRLEHRLGLEKAKETERLQAKALDTLMISHEIKKQILRERALSNKETIHLLKKQHEQRLRDSRKQLKMKKAKQLKQIKTYISELNNKILMKMQDGDLQKIVASMYKKY